MLLQGVQGIWGHAHCKAPASQDDGVLAKLLVCCARVRTARLDAEHVQMPREPAEHGNRGDKTHADDWLAPLNVLLDLLLLLQSRMLPGWQGKLTVADQVSLAPSRSAGTCRLKAQRRDGGSSHVKSAGDGYPPGMRPMRTDCNLEAVGPPQARFCR